ncbi:energy transducer TonB [Lysobacter sp. CA196]|uniref:energy transducer TonB n=1 Tax=Lysobacter sp. CA196 TaxID=3455606 RepID=UPI003F8D626C
MVVGALLAFAAADVPAQEATDILASIDISSYRLNPPAYPPEAIDACVGGTVVLLIDIDKDGQRSKAVVERSSGYAYFDQAAVEASKRWKYNPGTENGQRVAGKLRMPVDFAEYDGCWSGDVDIEARADEATMKAYPVKWPAIVKDKRLDGLVVLLIQVDRDGSKKDIKVGVSSGNEDIDQAAMLAALEWTFQPATLKGKPVRSLLQLPLPYGKRASR